jgi:hypothetical protein
MPDEAQRTLRDLGNKPVGDRVQECPVSAFLCLEDVRRLAGGKKRFSAMRAALDRQGIPYTVAGNGEPLVRESILDGCGRRERNRGPQWDRISQ